MFDGGGSCGGGCVMVVGICNLVMVVDWWVYAKYFFWFFDFFFSSDFGSFWFGYVAVFVLCVCSCDVLLGVCMGRVERIFWSNPLWWVKKNSTQLNPSQKSNPTQPNPHGSGWVRLNPWVWQIFLLLLLNWVEKYININILKKPKD